MPDDDDGGLLGGLFPGPVVVPGTPQAPELPDWIQNVGSEGKRLLQNPRSFIRSVIVDFVIGGILGLVLTVTDLIGMVFGTFQRAFGSAGASLINAGAAAGGVVFSTIATFNDAVVGIAVGFGFPGRVIALVLFIVEAAIVIRLLLAAGPALSDFIGSIPVVGGLVDFILTTASGFIGEVFDDG